MTEPKDIVLDLTKPGDQRMTELEIVEALKEMGVRATQATINRIKHGQQNTSFEIGRALVKLHEQRLSA